MREPLTIALSISGSLLEQAMAKVCRQRFAPYIAVLLSLVVWITLAKAHRSEARHQTDVMSRQHPTHERPQDDERCSASLFSP